MKEGYFPSSPEDQYRVMNPDDELFKPAYILAFRNYARSIACHPTNADQFVIGEGNGRISIHSIRNREQLRSTVLPAATQVKDFVTACSYSRDGQKLVCSLLTGKLSVLDVEACKMVRMYDDCSYKSHMKAGLAVDLSTDNLLASTDLGGKGITFYDWRQALPIRSIGKLHLTWIPDMEFVRHGWTWSHYCGSLLTVCTDGQAKIIGVDGMLVDGVDVGHITHCCTMTPEPFQCIGSEYYASFATVGGECLSNVLPEFCFNKKVPLPGLINALRVKFSSSGSRAFVGCDDGSLRIYKRLPQSLVEQNTLMVHRLAVSDLAVSCSDEHVITTSEDGNVYVTKVGYPNHGATEWFELA